MKQNKRKRKLAPAATTAVDVAASQDAAATPSTADNVATPAFDSKRTSSADYVLDAVCTIREGAALKSALISLEPEEKTVVLDVHAIERIDTAALQLLCAFVRDRRAKGRRTEWIGQPHVFAEAVDLLGLTQALGYAPEKAA